MHPDLVFFLVVCSWSVLFLASNFRVLFKKTPLSHEGKRIVLGFNTVLIGLAINFHPRSFELVPAMFVGAFLLAVPWLAERIPMFREREEESSNPESAPL